MNTFFSLLAFASLIALVAGLIKPSLIKMSTRPKVAIACAVVFFISVSVVGATTPVSEESTQEAVVKEPSSDKEETTVENKEEVKKDKTVKKKKANGDIKIDKELSFDQFDVGVKEVKVYEKKGKLLADIKLSWFNKIYDHDKTSFFIVSLLEVKQGEEELREINDAWNVDNKLRSDVFFPNAAGGRTNISLTYELKDRETPIVLLFTPTSDEEVTEKINVEING